MSSPQSTPSPRPAKTRGHRFLATSVGTVLGLSVAGGLAQRLRRDEPGDDDLLGAAAGEPVPVRGAGSSRIYAEVIRGRPGTMVFTHGWCLTQASWHYQKLGLGGSPWTVVAWDLPGHGRSTVPRGRDISFGLAVDGLARVVDQLTGDDVVLVGHSLGGMVTLSYLAENPETARAKVRGAVLVSTPLMHVPRSVAGRWPGAPLEAWALHTSLGLLLGNPGVDRILNAQAGSIGSATLSYRFIRTGFGTAPAPAVVRFVRDIIATVPREVRTRTFHAMAGYDLSSSVTEVEVPALVVLGTKDRVVNPAETRAIGDLLPRARVVEFPGAGHAAFLERAVAFNREVAGFAGPRLRARGRRAPSGDGPGDSPR